MLFNSMYIEEVKTMAVFLPRTSKENPVTEETISIVDELISAAKYSGRIKQKALHEVMNPKIYEKIFDPYNNNKAS